MDLKGLRRNLRRISERKGITYTQAILRFYGVKNLNQLDKKLVWSLTRIRLRISDEGF